MTEARPSIISVVSSIDHHGSSIVDDIDNLELQQRLEKFQREITELTFENILFETVLERKKPEPVIHHISSAVPPPVSSSQTTIPNGSIQDLINASATSRGDRLARKRSKSRSTQADFRIQLTFEQKFDIAISEYEVTRDEKIRCSTTHEKEIDRLESDREWIDGEITDFELAIAEFLKTRDSSIDKRTNNLLGERIIRYFTERLKGRELLKNRLRDRSFGFKRQIVRLDIQIKQNEEMGDTLQEVDFNQLKIENKQYLDKIDEKNLELVILKQRVARFTHLLNRYKDELHIKTQDSIDIQKRIDKQQALYEYAQREIITADYEQTRVEKKHNYLVEQTENYRVPEILDYVRKKALLYNLQRDCEVWQRKVEIVSMGLQQSKQKWQALQRSAQYSNRLPTWNNEL